MKIFLPLLFITIMTQQVTNAAVITIKGVIGDTDLSYKAIEIAPSSSASFKIKGVGVLYRIKEIYPDTPSQPAYTYDVYTGKRLIYRRDHQGTGFGPVSCFVEVPKLASKARTIKITNRSTNKIYISGIESITKSQITDIEAKDSFGLSGLLSAYHGPESEKKWLDELTAGIPVKKGFYRAFSTEIPYSAWPEDRINGLIGRHLKWAKDNDLVYFPSFVSWWAATPLGIEDGEGGKFGDLKYQQVCWSLDDNEDEGPEFRKLMGDRWNIHYGLSIPNEWSNVPWLTMNRKTLNAYRYKCLDKILGGFIDQIGTSGAKVAGVYLENEPRYWDTACEAGNPKRDWNITWADFNPFVIADAAKDGVNIDPSDGLGYDERLWLHRNVARYNQGVVNQANKTLSKKKSPVPVNIYTHSLQLIGFPGDEICHPMSEWAYVKGAYTGLEGMWCKLADFDRVREWGPWANLNREEGDGRIIEEHLWDLRVTYARGGQLFNSYNWNNVGAQRVFGYMKEFLDNLPSAKIGNASVTKSGSMIKFKTMPEIQGANRIIAQVMVTDPTVDTYEAIVRNSSGRMIGYSQVEGIFDKGLTDMDFIYSEPFELGQGEEGTLEIKPCSDKSRQSPSNIQAAKFVFDLKRERLQSIYALSNIIKK